jgi:hypothetical protein
MNTEEIQMSIEPTTQLSPDQLNRHIQTAGLIPQHWCDACAKATWMVTPEEAAEIAGISPSCYSAKAGKTVMMRNLHIVTTSTGAELICLKSLFLCIFSVCEAAA